MRPHVLAAAAAGQGEGWIGGPSSLGNSLASPSHVGLYGPFPHSPDHDRRATSAGVFSVSTPYAQSARPLGGSDTGRFCEIQFVIRFARNPNSRP
jgi:hypothetical protein